MEAPRRYLDTASGEPLHPAARAALEQALAHGYADPRRLHHEGRTGRLILDNARAATAEALGVRPDEITFTPSGTHAVHLGLLGLLQARRGGAHGSPAIVQASAVEHSGVRHAAAWARVDLVEVGVDAHGRVDPHDYSPEATVAALQSANHEVGTVQPVAEVAQRIGDVPLFVDACASAGRLPLPEGWSALAASAHKWGGPAGVGLLLVRRGAPWRPPFPGDDRVDPRATGMENVPAIFAAAAALQAVVAEAETQGARQRDLTERLRAGLATIPDTDVLGDPDDRLPHLVTCSFLYVDGEAVVGALDQAGFGVASGSACAASTLEPSHVLAAMGALTHGNVRISVGRDTTADDVDALVATLAREVPRIRAEAGL